MPIKRTKIIVLIIIGLLGAAAVGRTNTTEMQRLQEEGKKAELAARYPQALAAFQQGLELARQSGQQSDHRDFLNNIGNIYFTLGQFDQALVHYQQALAIDKKIKDRQSEGNDLTNIGMVFDSSGQYEQALAHYQQALAIKKKSKDRTGERINLSNIGIIYDNLGQHEQALVYYHQALAIDRELKDRQGEGDDLNNIGLAYNSLGQYEKALAHYQHSLAIHQEIKKREGERANLSNIGNVYITLEKYDQALVNYQLALALDRELKDRQREGADLSNIGIIYRNLSQYDQALLAYQQSLAIKRERGDRKGEADDLTNIGVVYDNLSQYSKALGSYKQALVIHRETKDRRSEGGDLTNIGIVYDNLGQYDKALAHYQEALAIKREIKDRKGEANDLTNIGTVYSKLGNYEKALAQFQQALFIHREIKTRKGESADLAAIGGVYANFGQYDKALAQFQQSLAISREIKDHKGEGENLDAIGEIYFNLGQYDKALAQFQQALAIAEKIKDRQGEGNILTNIGLFYNNLEQHGQALAHFRQALAIKREIRDRRGEGGDLGNIAMVYSETGQYAQALAYFHQAMAIDREIKNLSYEGNNLNNLGGLYVDLGQYEKALTYFQQALAIHRKIKDRRMEGADLSNIGVAYDKLGQYEKAHEAMTQSLIIAQEVGAPEYLWKAQRGLGSMEAKLARDAEAIKHYEQSLDTIESMRGELAATERRSSFMQGKLFVYDELIELLRSRHEQAPSRGYDRKAWEIFERKQGRQFLEEMGKSGARNFAGLPHEIKNQEMELETRLDKLYSILTKERSRPEVDYQRLQPLEGELQQAKAAFQTFKDQLRTIHPDYYALKYSQPAILTELQTKVLQPGEILLVYGVMEENTCIWVIGKESLAMHTIRIGEKDLSRQVKAFRITVLKTGDENNSPKVLLPQDDNEQKEEQLRYELYPLLFPEKVRTAIASGSRLYIIPTGPLYSLPFEALETQPPGQPRHYLVEDHAIAYLSSASLLKTLREAQARKKDKPPYPLLAFANPSYDPGSSSKGKTDDVTVRGLQTRAYQEIMQGEFAGLPETESEAREIKEILQAPDHSNPLQVKEAASRKNVMSLNQVAKLRQYRYLVFACHSILPGEIDRVLQPALVLSHPEKDGYLTMGDVFGIKLNADLVSLSACNTGRGVEVKGEGIMGMTRAFMYSGTPTVAVTLWSVESLSAKELNVGMYRYLRQGQSRAAALREIKLAMRRGEKGSQYQHPFFWAPLVVFGDGR